MSRRKPDDLEDQYAELRESVDGGCVKSKPKRKAPGWKVAEVLWLESRGQRCEARHPERVARCELHAGHEGQHKHSVATIQTLLWGEL